MIAPVKFVLTLAILLFVTAPALAQEDLVAAGEKVFKKCVACHTLEPGRNKIGPNLANILGRKAASVEGYNYSSALDRSEIEWTAENLNKFLERPSKLVPGTKMVFPGLKEEKDRAAVIAFLTSKFPGTAQPKAAAPAAAPAVAVAARDRTLPADYTPDVRYTLRTGIAEGRMVFIGFGGEIDGVVNSASDGAGGRCRPDQPDQWRGRKARHRPPGSGPRLAAGGRQGSQHDGRLPRPGGGRFRLFLLGAGSSRGRHGRRDFRGAGGDAAAGGGKAGYFDGPGQGAGADRQAAA